MSLDTDYYDRLRERAEYVLDRFTGQTLCKALALEINRPSPNYEIVERLVSEMEAQLAQENYYDSDIL